MKIILASLLLISIGCQAQENKDFHKLQAKVVEQPTLAISDTGDSIKTIDSLKVRLFDANSKLLQVKRYLNIVNKNPSQIKYLKGWLNVVIKEK